MKTKTPAHPMGPVGGPGGAIRRSLQGGGRAIPHPDPTQARKAVEEVCMAWHGIAPHRIASQGSGGEARPLLLPPLPRHLLPVSPLLLLPGPPPVAFATLALSAL